MPKLTALVCTSYGIVVTVRIQIFVGQCIRRCGQNVDVVGIDESSYLRIIVSGIQVIEPCLFVIVVSSILEGIPIGNGICAAVVVCSCKVAPSVVFVV